MKVKEESGKVGLKLNIQKTKIMASGPITSWQIDGDNNGNSERLYIFGLLDHMSGATTMVHKPGWEELPEVQGKEWWLCFTGVAL